MRSMCSGLRDLLAPPSQDDALPGGAAPLLVSAPPPAQGHAPSSPSFREEGALRAAERLEKGADLQQLSAAGGRSSQVGPWCTRDDRTILCSFMRWPLCVLHIS